MGDAARRTRPQRLRRTAILANLQQAAIAQPGFGDQIGNRQAQEFDLNDVIAGAMYVLFPEARDHNGNSLLAFVERMLTNSI
jgi:hypothetical protein